eukprot:TRINITY_DN7191_c0_g1_i5.p1 TRINITY_DN7191_c0_g1~~TRINITY_DN7191_c0_g1_i5.p1  ORF type:complete len:1762 (+),score=405.22 TRINITY_DN7191_c0_g1_i5:86-5371(+)
MEVQGEELRPHGFRAAASRWFSQFRWLLWKNYKLAVRNRSATILQLIAPAFFVISLYVFQESIKSSSTEYGDLYYDVHRNSETPIERIYPTVPPVHLPEGVECCWTFLYAPNNSSEVDYVVKMIAEDNDIPMSTIRGFATANDVDEFLMKNMNTTQAAILFDFSPSFNESLPRNLNYVLQVNGSDSYSHGQRIKHQASVLIPFTYAIERALLKYAIRGTNSAVQVSTDISLVRYPHEEMVVVDIIGERGPLWFFAALIVNFVIALGQIVHEKELKLRESMKIMGLYDSAYWCSWMANMAFFNTATVFEIIVVGCIFQFDFFLKNSFGLYFFLLELFSFTLISLAVVVSTVVKKSNAAVTLGFTMFFIGFFLQLAAGIVFATDAPDIVRWIFALVSPSMLQLGLGALGTATSKSSYEGLRWSVRSQPELTSSPGLSFDAMYCWLAADFFVYLLIGLYLDNVLASEYGTRKKFYYFLTPSYWTGKQATISYGEDIKRKRYTTENDQANKDDDVLAEEDGILNGKLLPKQSAVKLINLCKAYDRATCNSCASAENKPFVAVKDLCFAIEENSLFCLLGPNGAGKSTTIQMLIGFHPCTYGDAQIFGYSIRNNIAQIQSMLGVCHQFDILWEDLTGEEHLKLFAGIRNIPKDQSAREVASLLKEVNMESEKRMRASTYSGGMRRRLSIAIALIGDPKMVILDEPTTGMDPVSRREVWNVIEKAKKNRVILLTTHSMEEADILGEKIAIMKKGRMECVGSSLRLKQKFGAGYTITVGIGTQSGEEVFKRVREFFESNITECKLSVSSDPMSGYMSFAVPRESTKELIPFFNQLENRMSELKITDCQLSITTLEEVFMTIAEKEALTSETKILVEPSADNDDVDLPRVPASEDAKDDIELNTMDSVFEAPKATKFSKRTKLSKSNQFRALFAKNVALQSREKKTNICQVLTPPVFVAIVFLFQHLIESLVDTTSIPEIKSPMPVSPFHVLYDPSSGGGGGFRSISSGWSQLVYADPIGLGNYSDGSGLLGNITPIYGVPFDTKLSGFDPDSKNSFNLYGAANLLMPFEMVKARDKDDLEDILYRGHNLEPNYAGGYLFQKMDFQSYEFQFSVVYNHSLTFGEDVPFLINRVTNAIAKGLDSPASVALTGLKLFPTLASEGDKPDIITLSMGILIFLVLHQLFPVFVSNIVLEKETKIKELMRMTGLKMWLYWLIHYLFDYFLYLIIVVILIISGAVFQFAWFLVNDFSIYIILFLIYGHLLIVQSFIASVFFSSRKASTVFGYVALVVFALINFVLIEDLLGDYANVKSSISTGISVLPFFAIYRGLMYLSAEVNFKGPGFRLDDIGNKELNIAQVYWMLAVEWVVLMVLWMYLEQVVPSKWGITKHPLFFLGFGKSKGDYEAVLDTLPADVLQENERVLNGNSDDFAVQIQKIKKVFPSMDGNPPKTAVRQITLGIDYNRCVAILGHNGAGKTTLINMLIGLYPPTAGTAFVHGNNLVEELPTIHTLIGVCQQFDILWETLTGSEVLSFFARVRGLKGKRLEAVVHDALRKVNLYDFRNTQCGRYSGGMKRRLSVAVAFVNNPKVIFLDEPSTGLDPKSRQELWAVINELKKTSSLLLTTHSMEEADRIADKIVIIADGEMKCIGVSADLKNRFGDGFKLAIQVGKGHPVQPAQQFVTELCPNATLINQLSGTCTYQVPKGSISLDRVFEMMETNKERLNITDWAVTNTTLEEVFLKISEESHRHDNEDTHGESKEEHRGKSVDLP